MNMKLFLSYILIICLVISCSLPTTAEPSLMENSAQTLLKLNVMNGYPDGSLRLENPIVRSEFFTLTTKMMAYDKTTNIKDFNMNFSDMNSKHWAYDYTRILVKRQVVSGYPDNTVRPNNTVSYAEAITVMIHLLGYDTALSGAWPENMISKANELSLTANLMLKSNKLLTRGEIAILICNCLTIPIISD